MGKWNKGYTLVELMVVMGIFTVIMIITSKAFDRLVSSGSQESKAAVGQIEGIVGLEMLRKDVSHAGYGLFWSFPSGITPGYTEPAALPVTNGLLASSVSQNPPTLPRPIQVLATASSPTTPCAGSDYLVLRSVELALPAANSSVGRWGYLEWTGGSTSATIRMVGDVDSDVRSSLDRVITVASSFSSSGRQDKVLMAPNATTFSYAVPNPPYTAPAGFQPVDPSPNYVVYAIANDGGSELKMPYNRADYYIARPASDMPLSCSPGTGILYKAVADQNPNADTFTKYPLLNCVGDLRVVLQTDTGAFIPGASPTISALTTAQLRDQVKNATIYLLAHEGGKDQNYSYNPMDATNALFVGPYVGSTPLAGTGTMWTQDAMRQRFGPEWRKYRWKVYNIPVTLKNMRD